jgi:ATP-dependent DNA helicase RecQ
MQSPVTSPNIQTVLQQYWGYDRFRPPQQEIVQTLLTQRDALIIMATGGGKSICFQLPALLQPGLTIVISPLVALMENQVQALRSRQIAAAVLHNQLPKEARRQALWQLENQRLKLLYVSPETLLSPPVWQRLCQPGLRISSLILDEAHCLTQWGETFRPTYFRLGAVRSALLATKPAGTKINLAAFTATANPQDQATICQILQLEQPQVLRSSPYRNNLRLQVRSIHTPRQRRQELQQFLQRQAKSSGLVYVRTRKESEELAQWLQKLGFNVAAYHAGLTASDRRTIEQQWMNQQLQFVVCTNAFGMGIDKPDVRWIVHFHAPLLLTEYLQEIGRAGRDGKPATALMLVSSWLDNSDRQRWQFFQNSVIAQQKTAQKIFPQLPSIGNIDQVSKQNPQAALALSILHKQGKVIWRDPYEYEIVAATNTKGRSVDQTATNIQTLLRSRQCRWLTVLQAFGCHEYPATWQCGHCDRCG